jgi:hypothetical protein
MNGNRSVPLQICEKLLQLKAKFIFQRQLTEAYLQPRGMYCTYTRNTKMIIIIIITVLINKTNVTLKTIDYVGVWNISLTRK